MLNGRRPCGIWLVKRVRVWPGRGVADPGQLHVRRVSRYASVALLACLGLGQLAPHHRYLYLGYFGPRRIDVVTTLLGVMREDLIVADALALAQIYRAGVLANPPAIRPQPEDVQRRLVSHDQIVIEEGPEPLGLGPLVPIRGP
jgi:hypothetical protein